MTVKRSGPEPAGLVAALDSGGTKTACVVAEVDGTILGVGFGGPANANFVSRRTADRSLAGAAREALEAAGLTAGLPVPLLSVYAGVPGAPAGLVEGALAPVFSAGRWTTRGDDLSTFVGALVERYGVVALAGTGSFAMGFDREGRTVTLGGWGALLGDEGSGYDIGLQALRAVVRAEEGRGPGTVLSELITREWRLRRLRDLVARVYRRGSPRRRIASLAKLVAQAARDGDQVAAGILRQAGRELGELAGDVVARLDLRGAGCPVALTGGVAAAGGEFQAAFAEAVREADDTCRIVPPRFTPAGGALLLALEGAGTAVAPAVLANLEAGAGRFAGLKYASAQDGEAV